LDAVEVIGPLPAQPVMHLDAGIGRTHAWVTSMASCADAPSAQTVVTFSLALAGAAIICGQLIRRAQTWYR
jgi:hypothetical protein